MRDKICILLYIENVIYLLLLLLSHLVMAQGFLRKLRQHVHVAIYIELTFEIDYLVI